MVLYIVAAVFEGLLWAWQDDLIRFWGLAPQMGAYLLLAGAGMLVVSALGFVLLPSRAKRIASRTKASMTTRTFKNEKNAR